MPQVNELTNQFELPAAAFQPVAESRSLVFPMLSGSLALIGTAYPLTSARELAINQPAPQVAFQQEPQLATAIIPGRITGSVRLVQKVARAWNLKNDELASLLAYPSPLLADYLLAGKLTFSGNDDREDRARLVYLIHSTLSDLFVDADQEQHWIRAKNQLLGGRSPLHVMLTRRIPGMLAVRDVVERYLANRR